MTNKQGIGEKCNNPQAKNREFLKIVLEVPHLRILISLAFFLKKFVVKIFKDIFTRLSGQEYRIFSKCLCPSQKL